MISIKWKFSQQIVKLSQKWKDVDKKRIKIIIFIGSCRSRKLRLKKCYPDHIITSAIYGIQPDVHWLKIGTARIINDTVGATVGVRPGIDDDRVQQVPGEAVS